MLLPVQPSSVRTHSTVVRRAPAQSSQESFGNDTNVEVVDKTVKRPACGAIQQIALRAAYARPRRHKAAARWWRAAKQRSLFGALRSRLEAGTMSALVRAFRVVPHSIQTHRRSFSKKIASHSFASNAGNLGGCSYCPTRKTELVGPIVRDYRCPSHPAAALIEFVAVDNRLHIPPGCGKIDVLKELAL
jgi:hypothetical protein